MHSIGAVWLVRSEHVGGHFEMLHHQGLDDAGRHEQTAHLRSLLEHNGILPARDEPLARFERWLTQKLDAIT